MVGEGQRVALKKGSGIYSFSVNCLFKKMGDGAAKDWWKPYSVSKQVIFYILKKNNFELICNIFEIFDKVINIVINMINPI